MCGLVVFLSAGFFMLSKVLILNKVVRRLILILSFSAFVLHLIAFDIFLEDSKETHGIIIFDDVHAFQVLFKGRVQDYLLLMKDKSFSIAKSRKLG